MPEIDDILLELTFPKTGAPVWRGSTGPVRGPAGPIAPHHETIPGWGALTGALVLDGKALAVEAPLQIAGVCTLDALILPAKTRDAGTVVHAPGLGLRLELQPGADGPTPAAVLQLAGSSTTIAAAARPLATGWTRLSAVCTPDDLWLLVDGVVVARRDVMDEPAHAARPLVLGGPQGRAHTGFRGEIAGLRVVAGILAELRPDLAAAQAAGFDPIAGAWPGLGDEQVVARSERPDPARGRRRVFAGGEVHWTRTHRTQIVRDRVLRCYHRHGGPEALGLALSVDEPTGVAGRTRSRFERGMISCDPATAWLIPEAFVARWLDSGAERGLLGAPTGPAVADGRGRTQPYERGALYQVDDALFLLRGPILDEYRKHGGVDGSWGAPRSSTADLRGPACTRVRFEKHTAYHADSTGVQLLSPKFAALHERLGGHAGELGLPVAALVHHSDLDAQSCQGGVILDKGDGPFAATELRLFLETVNVRWIDDEGVRNFSALPYVFWRVKVDGKSVRNDRYPEKRGHDGASFPVRKELIVRPLRADTEVEMSLDVYDYDIVNDDHIGGLKMRFSAANIWGTTGGTAGYYKDKPADWVSEDVQKRSNLEFDYSASFVVKLDEDQHFRERDFWRFENFTGPAILTRRKYVETFRDVEVAPATIDQFLHPFDTLLYEVGYHDIADSGNCFGMALEALYVRSGRSPLARPLHAVVGSVDDRASISDDADVLPAVRDLINIKHGYQLGLGYLASTIPQVVTSIAGGDGGLPAFEFVERHLAAGVDCVLSMNIRKQDGKVIGHCVTPYRCERRAGTRAEPHRIWIADPNVVWREREGDVSAIEVTKDGWWLAVEYRNGTRKELEFGTDLSTHHFPALLTAGSFTSLDEQPRTVTSALFYMVLGLGLLILGDVDVSADAPLADGLVPLPLGTPLRGLALAGLGVGADTLNLSLRAGPRPTRLAAFAPTCGIAVATTWPGASPTRLTVAGLRDGLPAIEWDNPGELAGAGVALCLRRGGQPRELARVHATVHAARDHAGLVRVDPLDRALLLRSADGQRPITVEFAVDDAANGARLIAEIPAPIVGEAVRLRVPDWRRPGERVLVERLASADGGVLARSPIPVRRKP